MAPGLGLTGWIKLRASYSLCATSAPITIETIWKFPKIRGYLRVPLKGYYKPSIRAPLKGSKQGLGFRVSEY